MRVETVNGRHLLCGHILPASKIAHGQVWARADGANGDVRISGVRDGWVGYTWDAGQYNEKEAFAFQCRYCLVLPTNEIPEWVKEHP